MMENHQIMESAADMINDLFWEYLDISLNFYRTSLRICV